MALLLGLGGAVILIFVARYTGRGKEQISSSTVDEDPGQKL